MVEGYLSGRTQEELSEDLVERFNRLFGVDCTLKHQWYSFYAVVARPEHSEVYMSAQKELNEIMGRDIPDLEKTHRLVTKAISTMEEFLLSQGERTHETTRIENVEDTQFNLRGISNYNKAQLYKMVRDFTEALAREKGNARMLSGELQTREQIVIAGGVLSSEINSNPELKREFIAYMAQKELTEEETKSPAQYVLFSYDHLQKTVNELTLSKEALEEARQGDEQARNHQQENSQLKEKVSMLSSDLREARGALESGENGNEYLTQKISQLEIELRRVNRTLQTTEELVDNLD